MFLLRMFNRLAVRAAKWVAIAFAALITLFVFVSIVSRNFFSYSFEYAVEGNQLLFTWMCFMGIVAVHSSDMLLKFEMLEQHVPASLAKYWRTGLHSLVAVVAAVMVVTGREMLAFAESQRFSTMPVSYFWLYLPVSVAGVLIFFGSAEKIVNVWSDK